MNMHRARPRWTRSWQWFGLLLLAACAVNPVTGERQLQFYDADWERQTGAELYAPMRQAGGGDYIQDPALTAYVRDVGERLAAQARRRDTLDFEFRILNDSTPNAWALPGGKIVVNRGLLTRLNSEAELAAVLAHEIVHADAAHSAQQQSKGVLTQIGATAGMVLIGSQVDSSAGQQAAAMVPALGAQLITQKFSRDAEREADQYGMRYMADAGYDPQGAVQLQETFLRLSEGRDPDWLNGLFASHPPSRERLERNRAMAQKLPAGGHTEPQRYARMMAGLMRSAPAYAAYDEAIAAAGRGEFDRARPLLDRALEQEPDEALFHALDGDLKAHTGALGEALLAYDRAVARNGEYFYHVLRRGQAHLKLGQPAAARRDLERSLALLPTSLGHYLLGNLERDAGRRDAARGHYEQAARSDSETGRQAQRELVLMEIAEDPGRFVATAPAADGSGNLYCVVANRTSVALDGITVRAGFSDDAGSRQQGRVRLDAALAAQQRANIALGWRTMTTAGLDNRVSCEVEAARVAD